MTEELLLPPTPIGCMCGGVALDSHPPQGKPRGARPPPPPEPRCDPCPGRVRNEPKMLTLSNTLFFGTWHLFDETSISTKG